jgi:transcriptional regulator, TetR family
MREVARRAGCTHQAPYHYFANREAILAALIEAGFHELANRLCEAHDLVKTEDLRTVAEASGNAYVEFALTNPGVFRIMFRRDMCDPARFPGIQVASRRTYDELGRLARIRFGEHAIREHETALWASVHGLAVLLLDGLMADEFPALEDRLAYARRVNRLGCEVMLGRECGGEQGVSGS